MTEEKIRSLIELDKFPYEGNDITDLMLKDIDDILYSKECTQNISEEALSVYNKFVPMKSEAPEGMKNDLFRVMRNFIKEKCENKEFFNALFLCRFLVVKTNLIANDYFNLAEILFALGKENLSFLYLKLYERKEKNKPLLFITLANFYNLQIRDYKKAIKYYEKYIEIDKTKPVVYTIVGSLYAKVYGDLSLKDQIFYFRKAYSLKPTDRLILHGLAFAYEKIGDKEDADTFYKKLLENNPTEIDYYNYGAFLISCGDFINGHKYFAHRFLIEDENLKYPMAYDIERKWDFQSDISNKVLLVHYEQGFGDTIMYCRFVPELKKLAKKVIFVVQDSLYDLIKSSSLVSDGIEVVSDREDISKLEYDFNMALLDAPLALKVEVSKIPYTDREYLEVDSKKVRDYAEKYIKKSDNLKVGIAYCGDKNSNYNGRDIELNRFKNLLNIEGVDFYSLQVNSEDESDYNIFRLGSTFRDFTDTACAIKNMDIVVSTDNVILNLAGALGVKTYGLFNSYTNYRWYKLSGTDVGWYRSVEPIQADEANCWRDVFGKLVKNILKFSKQVAKK